MPSSRGYVRHFVACNRHDPCRFIPFYIGGRRYGFMGKGLAASLVRETGFFEARDGGIALAAHFGNFAARSEALREATQAIAGKYGKPLHGELYAVVEKWDDAPVAQLDRAAVPWFGVRAWGVHVNGFVRKRDGIYLWIGQRAANRQAYPGQLDNMIGGGQPIGLSPEQNLCKEAWEEAGIDRDLALTARKAGEIGYVLERPEGLRTDTLFIYDLELSESFTPRNTDGEVASFTLMPLPEVAALVRDTDKFKFNCNLVVADFMMRHGFITPQDGEYAELRRWLKSGSF
ncbi:MAG: DUF4743 domain-containing protein [Alphaproteobacteria bacterium]|nr:DUF4743 domain-containing protein [Alphaproteobacteria bacterium]